MLNIPELIGKSLDRPERETHGGLHVSDVANGCVRAVWHRIHKGLRPTFSPEIRKKMEYGNAWESVIRNSLLSTGSELHQPEVVIFHPDRETEVIPADVFDENPHEFAGEADLVGHPDLVIKGGPVIEVKTTMLFRQGYAPPTHPDLEGIQLKSRNYLLQTVAYAKAYLKRGLLYVSDRGTGLDRQYEVSEATEWPVFNQRWNAMMPALDPSTEPEAAPPPWTMNKSGSYLCKSCPVKTCSLNQNKGVVKS